MQTTRILNKDELMYKRLKKRPQFIHYLQKMKNSFSNFIDQLKQNSLPSQDQLFSILRDKGPFSKQINSYIGGLKNTKQSQRQKIKQIFSRNFKEIQWKSEQPNRIIQILTNKLSLNQKQIKLIKSTVEIGNADLLRILLIKNVNEENEEQISYTQEVITKLFALRPFYIEYQEQNINLIEQQKIEIRANQKAIEEQHQSQNHNELMNMSSKAFVNKQVLSNNRSNDEQLTPGSLNQHFNFLSNPNASNSVSFKPVIEQNPVKHQNIYDKNLQNGMYESNLLQSKSQTFYSIVQVQDNKQAQNIDHSPFKNSMMRKIPLQHSIISEENSVEYIQIEDDIQQIKPESIQKPNVQNRYNNTNSKFSLNSTEQKIKQHSKSIEQGDNLYGMQLQMQQIIYKPEKGQTSQNSMQDDSKNLNQQLQMYEKLNSIKFNTTSQSEKVDLNISNVLKKSYLRLSELNPSKLTDAQQNNINQKSPVIQKVNTQNPNKQESSKQKFTKTDKDTLFLILKRSKIRIIWQDRKIGIQIVLINSNQNANSQIVLNFNYLYQLNEKLITLKKDKNQNHPLIKPIKNEISSYSKLYMLFERAYISLVYAYLFSCDSSALQTKESLIESCNLSAFQALIQKIEQAKRQMQRQLYQSCDKELIIQDILTPNLKQIQFNQSQRQIQLVKHIQWKLGIKGQNQLYQSKQPSFSTLQNMTSNTINGNKLVSDSINHSVTVTNKGDEITPGNDSKNEIMENLQNKNNQMPLKNTIVSPPTMSQSMLKESMTHLTNPIFGQTGNVTNQMIRKYIQQMIQPTNFDIMNAKKLQIINEQHKNLREQKINQSRGFNTSKELIFRFNQRQIDRIQVHKEDQNKTLLEIIKQINSSILKNISLEKSVRCFLKFQSKLRATETSINRKINQIPMFNDLSYPNIICQIQQFICITLDNDQKKYFAKGIQAQQILSKLRLNLRSRQFTYVFFSNYLEYTDTYIEKDLQLRECQICNIRYLGKIIRNLYVPMKICAKQLIFYLPIDKQKVQRLDTAYISKVKYQDTEHSINLNQNISDVIQNHKIDQVRIEYYLQLKIEITSNNPREIIFKANSSQKISQLKERFAKQCNIDAKLQQWMGGDKILTNQTSFEDLKFFTCFLSLEVNQIKNLEYYGFSTEEKINPDIFRSYYIQNDEELVNLIQQMDFPEKDFQSPFRIKVLAKIFSCIKKHCRIKTALNTIRTIVSNSKKRCNLWKSPDPKQPTKFNENYVLFNIFNSSSQQFITEICRTYKHHSALPLKTKKSNGQENSLFESHYWICTKSICIVSLDIFEVIKGKSTFLNKIFRTDFQVQNKHPLCNNTVFIKYNVYRNERYLVDLIDVSQQSLNQKQKIQLAHHANILMIHLFQRQQKQVKRWLNKNSPNIPVIFIFRDNELLNNEVLYNRQMQNNEGLQSEQRFYIPEMNLQNVGHYEVHFCEISNQIHKFIVNFEASQQDQNKWKLQEFFQQKNDRLVSYTNKIKKLEAQFSTLIDIRLINSSNSQDKNLKISKTFIQLFYFWDDKDISNFMGKLRQFSRIQRNTNLRKYDSLDIIHNILQKKNQKKYEEQKIQIEASIAKLKIIDKNLTTQNFQKSLQSVDKQKNKMSYQKLENIYKILQKQYEQQIRKREFSIQSFWRFILYVQQSTRKGNKNNNINQNTRKRIMSTSKKIFQQQFRKGKAIQLINGDTLQIPMSLFKNHQIIKNKSDVMVIAIVGGQSSGKSTLLNFLFGCDFLSGEGRCTSGVYSSYYQIQGETIPGCNGVLVLDTEGLFGNYERQTQEGRNFGNKLVLFLLKTCDLVIVNNRGDVSKSIQDILEISFDSDLMKYTPGVKYPNLNVVLNIKTDNIQGQNVNKHQIMKLRDMIIKSKPYMGDYFNSEQSNMLPYAFPPKCSEGVTTYLDRIQSTNKVATTQFYEATRNLSLALLNILSRRGREFTPRNLAEVYDQMDSTWSGLINLPILTKHTNVKTKQFYDQIEKFIFALNTNMEAKLNKMNLQIPQSIIAIDKWTSEKQTYNSFFQQEKKSEYEKQFMNKDPQTDAIASLKLTQIKNRFQTFKTKVKLLITEKKYNLTLSESKNRGIDDLNRKARLYRGQNLSKKQIENKWLLCWSEHTRDMRQKIDRKKNSFEIHQNVQKYYGVYVKSNLDISLSEISIAQLNFEKVQDLDYNQYYQTIMNLFNQKLSAANTLEHIEIQPVISLSNKGITDLKFNYFNMQNFFQSKNQQVGYYLQFNYLSQFLNTNQIIRKTENQLRKSQFIINFIQNISIDFKKFGIKLQNQLIINLIIQSFKKRNFQLEQKPFVGSNIFLSFDSQILNQKVEQIMQNNQSAKSKNSKLKFENSETHKTRQKLRSNANKKSQKNSQIIMVDQNCQSENCQDSFNTFSRQQFFNCYYKSKKYYNGYFNIVDNWFKFHQEVMKYLVRSLINNYTETNLNFYQQTKKKLIQNHARKGFQQLKKIGISTQNFELRIMQNQLKTKQNWKCKPQKVENKSKLFQIISNFSSLINKQKIKQNLNSDPQNSQNYKNKQMIAYSMQITIQIKNQYKQNKILSQYKNKNYNLLIKSLRDKPFIEEMKKHISFIRILQKIKNKIQSMSSEAKIQNYVQQTSIVIKNQLQQFNNDLKQLSRSLTLQFKFIIHQMTKRLLWKKLEIAKMKQNRKIQEKLKDDQKKQKTIFFAIIQSNSQQGCAANAKIFITQYQKNLEILINSQKQKFINQRTAYFLKSHTREHLQDFVDSQIIRKGNENEIFNYVLNPTKTFNFYHEKFIQEQIKFIQGNFKCVSMEAIYEMRSILKYMVSKLKGRQSYMEADLLFLDEFVAKKEKNQLGSHLHHVFKELLLKGQHISCSYKNNTFKIKQGITLDTQRALKNIINLNIVKLLPDFQISNLSYFILEAQKQFDLMEKYIANLIKLQKQEIQEFKESVKLYICNMACPCCDRLCDMDMRKYPYHKVHKIDSGHQMRAIKGMIVQSSNNKNSEKFASILRCEDICPRTSFEFYDKQYTWEQFVQSKKDSWNFKSKNLGQQFFKRVWDICGRRICEYHTSKGKLMKFIDYTQGNIKFAQTQFIVNQGMQHIFAIDGSTSMQGTRWQEQKKQLKKVLSDISKNPKNTVSILVFNTECHAFCINKDPTKVDVNTIKFPGGSTTPDPTFLKAASIIRSVNSRQKKSVYFFYISDGEAIHPINGIRELLRCKQELKANKKQFKYCQIMIEASQKGKQFSERINKQMGGQCGYVSNAEGLSQAIKQYLYK